MFRLTVFKKCDGCTTSLVPSGYHQCNGDTNSIYLLRLLGGLSKIMPVNCFEQSGIDALYVRFCCCFVQSLSCVQLFVTPWTAARQASLSFTRSPNLLKLISIESEMPSNHLILCRPLLLLPPIPPSIRVFSSESTLRMRWPKYWSFSFSIRPSNEHPGLISFRRDWLDLLAVQGTLKSLLQHHSLKASVFRCSAFFSVQLSHPFRSS